MTRRPAVESVPRAAADPGVYPWGGKLYMAFNSVGKFTNDDTFGHFETQNESINNAPKHRAVVGGGGR